MTTQIDLSTIFIDSNGTLTEETVTHHMVDEDFTPITSMDDIRLLIPQNA